ncbi:hypothetical protein S245_016411, partial [Arachis hypogaea]
YYLHICLNCSYCTTTHPHKGERFGEVGSGNLLESYLPSSSCASYGDLEEKPAMEFIYEEMKSAKKKIRDTFQRVETT